ncbi:MAG: class I SAM-dependent methyltransferase [Proteobacteria bacterium]|nr:class I SAM-dependent methyltransferase [Pseudomonadota bacterium]
MKLAAAAALFVRNGGRDVELKGTVTHAPGAQVTLVDERDEEVGLAIVDPENARLRVISTPADGFTKIDGALIGWRIERALAWRKQLGLVGADRAYRIVHGAGDGLPGFACDVFGKIAVVYAYGDALRAVGKLVAEAVVGFARLDGAVVKLRARGGADAVEQDVIGAVPEVAIATEGDVPYEIHPLGGLNAGLFTDMRDHRRGLARFAADRRVLNLFSYTGALGLACARAGARTVTNVDTSAGVQAWASGNFKRSGLVDGQRWRFETGDASRFLQRAIKDGEKYDLVVIDPPTFSPARGGSGWILDRDYPDLIAKAAATIPPDGLLWLAANTHELASLGKLAFKGLKLANRTGAILEQGGLPPDYPTLVAQPADRYLQVCLLRLS